MSEQRDEHIKALMEQHAAQRREFDRAQARRLSRALLARTGKVPPCRRAAAQARLRRGGRGGGMSGLYGTDHAEDGAARHWNPA
jgi:hypothetical protein